MTTNTDTRIPPQDAGAEQAVLGAMLIDSGIIPEVTLQGVDFYRTSNGRIYLAMKELDAKGTPVDLVTLSEYLNTTGQLEHVGGDAYIASLASGAVTSANHVYHAAIVREKADRRRLMRRCMIVLNDCYEEAPLEEIMERLYEDLGVGAGSELIHRHIRDVARTVREQTDNRYALRQGDKLAIGGIPSGFYDLDRITDGFQKKQLYVMGARPGMGKSAFMGQVVAYAGRTHRCHVQNLEMDNERQVARMVMDQGGIESYKIRKAMMKREEWTVFYDTLEELRELNVTFDDRSSSLAELRQSIVKAARAGAELVGVDYIQLVRNMNARSREREVGEVGTELKDLAKRYDLAVIAIAALNRGVEQRENKRPLLSDLRESGQLESDADVVMFLYRADYYRKRDAEPDGKAELIIAKGRDIGESTIDLLWDDQRARFMPKEG